MGIINYRRCLGEVINTLLMPHMRQRQRDYELLRASLSVTVFSYKYLLILKHLYGIIMEICNKQTGCRIPNLRCIRRYLKILAK